MRTLTIAERIWLALSVLVFGYLLSLGAAYLTSIHTGRDISELGTAVFPAAQCGNDALHAFDRQVRSYEDAVAAAETAFIKAADEQAQQVHDALRKLRLLLEEQSELDDLVRSQETSYTAWARDASTAYGAALGQGDGVFSEAAQRDLFRMAAWTKRVRSGFLQLRSTLIHRQHAAVTEAGRRSARLRDMNLIAFCLVMLASVLTVSRTLDRHTIQPLNKLVRTIGREEQVSQDAFPNGEIGDAARKVYALFEKEKEATELLARHKQDLEQTVEKRTRELRQAHDALEDTLEKAPFGVLVIGMDRRIRWLNGGIVRMLGADSAQSLVGHPCGEYFDCAGGNPSSPGPALCDEGKGEEEIRTLFGGCLHVLRETIHTVWDGEDAVLETFVDITEHKRIQSELEQAHKLEAVGQLAAGIAHEINTPTQFIGDHLQFLKEGLEDLEPLLRKYEELLAAAKSGSVPAGLPEDVAELQEEADQEYFREHAPKAIDQALDGVGRVASIVRAMKDFAHPGPATMTATNLNQAIQSTVTVCRNEWKYVAEMELALDDSLPPIVCIPGEINQVVLNMLVNAAHALADKHSGNEGELGRITITTTQENGCARISIADTGTGIPPDALSKIFDPFFTTKEVGKGTGQGLAIAHNIVVQKHGGSIDVESKPGEGTEFLIMLPVSRPDEPAAQSDGDTDA